jgi:CRISPR-associated protein Cas5d
MKVERVSYELMTPSAARGVLEAILWKPQISWHIHAIEVLAPIRWASFRRNEVQSRASERTGEILVDEDRTQRNTVALRDVDYVIVGSFALSSRAGAGDNVAKYVEMFLRRLRKGQHHHAPYLGCREFAARVELASDVPVPVDPTIDRPLGEMFYDFDWQDFSGGEPPTAGAPIRPLFFPARLSGGILRVPHRDEVRAMNGEPKR